MLRMVANLFSPAGARAKLAILIFHRVLPAPDPLLEGEVDAATFERHIAFIRRDFNVLPLHEAARRLGENTLPARALCITFDDGYANNEEIALPILLRQGVVATFFIATGFLDGSAMFNDDVIEIVRSAPDGRHDLAALGLPSFSLTDDASRRSCIAALLEQLKYRPVVERSALVQRLADAMRGSPAKDLMMRPAQVRRLADSGMEIGGHTVNHPILTRIDEQEARAEIIRGKERLEDITGRRVTSFAYPNGRPGRDYGPAHVALVREAGFATAVSTANGVAGRGADAFQLPRCGLWERDPRRLGARLVAESIRATCA